MTGIDGRRSDDAALTLCRHELLRPRHPSTLPGHAEYEMHHALVRDVVYGSLTRATKTIVHERYGRWVLELGDVLPDRSARAGHHLERAYRARIDQGQAGAEVDALGAEAAELLTQAGVDATASGRESDAIDLSGGRSTSGRSRHGEDGMRPMPSGSPCPTSERRPRPTPSARSYTAARPRSAIPHWSSAPDSSTSTTS